MSRDVGNTSHWQWRLGRPGLRPEVVATEAALVNPPVIATKAAGILAFALLTKDLWRIDDRVR